MVFAEISEIERSSCFPPFAEVAADMPDAPEACRSKRFPDAEGASEGVAETPESDFKSRGRPDMCDMSERVEYERRYALRCFLCMGSCCSMYFAVGRLYGLCSKNGLINITIAVAGCGKKDSPSYVGGGELYFIEWIKGSFSSLS